MRAGLSYSVNVNGQWSAPTPIHIQNDYNVSEHANAFRFLEEWCRHICHSTGKKPWANATLYVSFWNGVEATEPVNMGAVINSNLEESSPYLLPLIIRRFILHPKVTAGLAGMTFL